MLSPEYIIKSSKLQTKLTAQQPFDQVAIHSQMPATLKEDVHMHKCMYIYIYKNVDAV